MDCGSGNFVQLKRARNHFFILSGVEREKLRNVLSGRSRSGFCWILTRFFLNLGSISGSSSISNRFFFLRVGSGSGFS